jgi:hypothetical protein
MYNVNDILAKLQNGESADSIAQAFADTLNAAIQKKEEEDKKVSIRENKIKHIGEILELVIDFIETYYPELAADLDLSSEETDLEAVVDELDRTIAGITTINTVLKTPATNSFDSIMGDFFKKNGLM